MLYFERWKVIAIWAVCALGVLFTLPNFIPRQQLAALPSWIPHGQMNLGLDLRGGSHLLLEVDMPAVVRASMENVVDAVRTKLRGASIGYVNLAARDRAVTVTLTTPGQGAEAVRLVKEPLTTGGQSDYEVTVTPEGVLTVAMTEAAYRDKAGKAVAQSIEIVRRRIDETGVNEPIIARQGADRILVQLPGIDDPDRVKRLLGTTAKMTFRLLEPNADPASGNVPAGAQILQADAEKAGAGQPRQYVVRRRVEVDGANLTNASAGNNQNGEWVVNFEFDSIGARRFGQVTKDNVGKPFAIVLDNKVISAPVIREPITGGRGQISGSFNAQSANDLAVLLRAGALPAPLTIVEERTVGPDLGADSIRAGLFSCLVGFTLVVVYIVASYGFFGVCACVALVFNLFLTIAVLSLLHATLTLPGIAGLLLTVGMSVDANILINERIREETRKGQTPAAAMQAGFQRAFSTIVDSNLTTLIKMLLLFAIGYGPIKGFAVTISLGILTSMFTATVLVRLMLVTWLRRTRPAMLPV